MTPQQLELLTSIADGNIYRTPTRSECEAVRAILAERAELIRGCQIALDYAVKYCTVPDRSSRLKPVLDILERANPPGPEGGSREGA